MKKLLQSTLFIFLTILAFASSAQTSSINGKVVDQKTGEELIGVSVQLEGTSIGASTDYEGQFAIANIKPGIYNLIVSYISYTKKVVNNVVVKANEPVTVRITLEEATNELNEVVITGELKKETQNALLIQQRNAVSIGNGISADVIKQTPDNNTGEVMKRISGATIQQGKFAVIRGLNDRYNAAMINGSPLPSTEPERRAFSFDLIPSNMVDQILIVKTATPDLPGDFAGGVIQVTTKETPDKPFFNVQLGLGVNHLTTSKTFKTYQGSATDALGFDNGTRQLPNEFPTTQELRTGTNMQRAQKEADAGKLLNNNYSIFSNSALPNTSIQLSGGKTYNIKEAKLGVVFSTSYSNSNSFQQVERNWTDFTKNKQYTYLDSMYENNVKLGALLNVSLKLKKNHKLSFKNTFNQTGEDIMASRVGPSQAEGIHKQAYSYMFTQNSMLLNQLNGEHFEPKSKAKFNWELSRGYTSRQMPDYKNVEYRGSNPYNLTLAVINAANENAARLFTNLTEKLHSASASVQLPMPYVKRSTIKAGYFYQHKDRTFDARMMGFAIARTSTFNQALRGLPIDEVFSYDNMGLHGFKLNDITNASHKYTANALLNAAYIMLENKIGARFKVIWGARYEAYNQQLLSATRNNDTVDINTNFNDLLPSLNVVYSLNDKSNLRFSASKTVSRPELRELAPFSFYDFSTSSSLEGNDKLQRATIQNFDFRYEIYPAVGQVFSVAVFYKNFTNPIELVLANDITLGVVRRSFVNLPSAKSLGAELDFRFDLLKSLTAYGNFSYIQSVVDQGDNLNRWSDKRPMQGQSPYIANMGLLYKFKKYDVAVSALYNIYGDRIYNVGNTSFPDIYEKNRHLLDLQISKLFLNKKLEMKLGVSDVLAKDLVFYMDYDKNNAYNEDSDVAVFRYKMPRIINFSVSYKF